MKSMNELRKRKAISPVIATVILVAVAITVAVAVAYWMGGIAGQYTQFEKVEIQTAICTFDTNGNWKIEIKLKNSGSKVSTLTNIFVNSVETELYDQLQATAGKITTSLTTVTPFSIGSGDSKSASVWIGKGYGTLSSGTTVEIKIHSAGGMDYIKLVQLI